VDDAQGRQSVIESRVRLFAERRFELGSHVRLNLAGYVDGLVARRRHPSDFRLKAEATSDAIVRPMDVYIDVVTPRFDVRAGAARLVWGRLDEFQPTDVVNPIDLSRFLMEGRSEARLAVGLVRARAFLPRSTTIEAVVVPHFRRSRFDQLDEPSSPFDLTRSPEIRLTPDSTTIAIGRARDDPDAGMESLQGGVRLTTTTARVDWSVSAYRGLKAFPISTLVGADVNVGPYIRESFPRYTMIGADFETVRGLWGVRGEVAAFVEDELQVVGADLQVGPYGIPDLQVGPRGIPGRSITAGVGIDRRAGDYRIAANVLWSRSDVDESDPAALPFVGDDEVERTDLSLVLAADRSFARETRTLRVFAAYDPADSTAFTRVIGAISVRDNVWIEGSGGVFTGSSLDIIGRLTRRDFVYARLKVYF
jgi:hypothetical protein